MVYNLLCVTLLYYDIYYTILCYTMRYYTVYYTTTLYYRRGRYMRRGGGHYGDHRRGWGRGRLVITALCSVCM